MKKILKLTARLVILSSAGLLCWFCLSAVDNGTGEANLPPVIDSHIYASPNPVINENACSLMITAHDPDNGPKALVYQWQGIYGPDVVTFVPNNSPLAGSTRATFTQSGQYTLKVNVYDGTDSISEQVTLRVTVGTSGAPAIMTQPAGGQFNAGDSTQLAVTAIGDKPLNYCWHHDHLIVDTNSPILQIPNIQSSDSGQYQVIVTNLSGTTQSETAALTVNRTSPFLTVTPGDQTSILGGTVRFAAAARGTEPLHATWRHGTEVVGEGTLLTLTNVSTADEGLYTVTVDNDVGRVVSIPAVLTVHDAPRKNVSTTPTVMLYIAEPGSTTVQTQALVINNLSDEPRLVRLSTTTPWLTFSPASAAIDGRNSKTFHVMADPTGSTDVVTGQIQIVDDPHGQNATLPVYFDLTGKGDVGRTYGCEVSGPSGNRGFAMVAGLLGLAAACYLGRRLTATIR